MEGSKQTFLSYREGKVPWLQQPWLILCIYCGSLLSLTLLLVCWRSQATDAVVWGAYNPTSVETGVETCIETCVETCIETCVETCVETSVVMNDDDPLWIPDKTTWSQAIKKILPRYMIWQQFHLTTYKNFWKLSHYVLSVWQKCDPKIATIHLELFCKWWWIRKFAQAWPNVKFWLLNLPLAFFKISG